MTKWRCCWRPCIWPKTFSFKQTECCQTVGLQTCNDAVQQQLIYTLFYRGFSKYILAVFSFDNQCTIKFGTSQNPIPQHFQETRKADIRIDLTGTQSLLYRCCLPQLHTSGSCNCYWHQVVELYGKRMQVSEPKH